MPVNLVILSVIRHRQNPFEAAYAFGFHLSECCKALIKFNKLLASQFNFDVVL
jgi:hypothetical protein